MSCKGKTNNLPTLDKVECPEYDFYNQPLFYHIKIYVGEIIAKKEGRKEYIIIKGGEKEYKDMEFVNVVICIKGGTNKTYKKREKVVRYVTCKIIENKEDLLLEVL